MEASQKETVWLSARNILRQKLNEDTYNRWIRSISAVDYDGEQEFVLGVSDDFFADWLEEHYTDYIIDALKEATGKSDIKFRFEVGHIPPEEFYEETLAEQQNKKMDAVSNLDIPNCNPKFVFDTFVVGDGNNFAYSAAKAVGQYPGISFNPLFIYGGTGLGKTHLMQAAAHEALKLRRNLKIEYLTCEQFFNTYIEAIQNNKFQEFRKRFRTADMLLIDDVHFLANKNKLQEEFFNTFNDLYNENRQIVLTSDRPPSDIDGLESRLVSRFENGLTTDVQPPGMETRMAILRKKMEGQSVVLDDEILFFMASKITSNVRRLEGALIRLLAFCSMTGTKITQEMAESLLQPIIMQESVTKVTIEMIQKKVAEHFDLRVGDMLSKKRPQNIAFPRMVAMYLSRELTGCSLPEIGAAFGGRTHATVISAINKISKERKNDKKLDNSVSLIQRQLQNN